MIRRCYGLLLLSSSLLMAQSFEYGGPSVLNRGPNRLARVGQEDVRMQFYVHLGGVYDSGLFAFATDVNGQPIGAVSWGAEAGIGATGRKEWKLSSLALAYRGDYSHYTRNPYFNGWNQALNLTYDRQINARWSFGVNSASGITNRSVGPYSSWLYGSGDYLGVPHYELFNNPTTYGEGRGWLAHNFSSRTTLRLGSSGFIVRRRSIGLVGADGFSATADLTRRMSRTTTIGGGYAFMQFRFSRQYGSSDIHTGTFSFGQDFGRDWTLSLTASALRVESTGLTQVQLDPIVASILGQGTGVEAFHAINLLPNYNGMLVRKFRRASWQLEGHRSIFPGNGIFLTSLDTGGSTSYNYLVSQWNVTFGASYGKWSSITRALPEYRNYGGGAGISRQLFRGVHLTARWDYRQIESGNDKYDRAGHRATLGLAFTPNDVPLSLW